MIAPSLRQHCANCLIKSNMPYHKIFSSAQMWGSYTYIVQYKIRQYVSSIIFYSIYHVLSCPWSTGYLAGSYLGNVHEVFHGILQKDIFWENSMLLFSSKNKSKSKVGSKVGKCSSSSVPSKYLPPEKREKRKRWIYCIPQGHSCHRLQLPWTQRLVHLALKKNTNNLL